MHFSQSFPEFTSAMNCSINCPSYNHLLGPGSWSPLASRSAPVVVAVAALLSRASLAVNFPDKFAALSNIETPFCP